ncbi:MAG TPA: aromatic ring-hydroxylating dioxygenase subunit alpha [Acidimicrobiales bacterium]|nr:aromatic ring-hydroxylating dioxygenase subunit alpha [Acidimicrobiales bacterium]
MAIVDHNRPVLPVPFALEVPDRARKERYYDPEFFQLEVDQLWSRTWQMACRLEEIPRPHDYVTYDILGQSVVVVRTEDMGVNAFHNACRHRGVQVAEARGTCESGFTCPFHGWCYGPDGKNTFVSKRSSFSERNMQPGDLDLRPVRAETWGGCAWINLDDDAPPLRPCIEPFATIMEGWEIESLHPEWWYSVRLPVNWKLAEEAFMEQYHVIEAHPQLVDPRRFAPRDPSTFDPRAWLDAEIRYLHTMSEGMAGMVHARDVAIAEGLRDIELPSEPAAAMETWHRTYEDAVVRWHREHGFPVPDLAELAATGRNEPMGYCFPHFFVLPMYSSASSYRFRPLGPEETLMEIWSLTRFPEGEDPPAPIPPEPWECDDPRVPPIPQQDFSNLPRQQRGVHAKGFEYMRFSENIEGGIANFEHTVDGFLAGLPYDTLLTALAEVNVNPLERPVADLGF